MMIPLEMMLEVVNGVLVMEVEKVADEVTDMKIDKVTDIKIPIENLADVILVFCLWQCFSFDDLNFAHHNTPN